MKIPYQIIMFKGGFLLIDIKAKNKCGDLTLFNKTGFAEILEVVKSENDFKTNGLYNRIAKTTETESNNGYNYFILAASKNLNLPVPETEDYEDAWKYHTSVSGGIPSLEKFIDRCNDDIEFRNMWAKDEFRTQLEMELYIEAPTNEVESIEEICSKCCDDINDYAIVGKVFQWLINNDYLISKK